VGFVARRAVLGVVLVVVATMSLGSTTGSASRTIPMGREVVLGAGVGVWDLYGVSCVAAACQVVGMTTLDDGYAAGSSDGGQHWTVEHVPSAVKRLEDVSCASTLHCVAVGQICQQRRPRSCHYERGALVVAAHASGAASLRRQHLVSLDEGVLRACEPCAHWRRRPEHAERRCRVVAPCAAAVGCQRRRTLVSDRHRVRGPGGPVWQRCARTQDSEWRNRLVGSAPLHPTWILSRQPVLPGRVDLLRAGRA